jgi:hypothetical protein
LLIVNAPGWVGQWWYILAMVAYVGIIVVNAYNWGRMAAERKWSKLAQDQTDLMVKMNAELEDYASHTVALPVMVLPNLDEPTQNVYIVHGLSMN